MLYTDLLRCCRSTPACICRNVPLSWAARRLWTTLNYGSLALQEAMSGELRKIAARCDDYSILSVWTPLPSA